MVFSRGASIIRCNITPCLSFYNNRQMRRLLSSQINKDENAIQLTKKTVGRPKKVKDNDKEPPFSVVLPPQSNRDSGK